MYYFIGVFMAQVVVDFTEEVVMTEYYGTFIENLVSRFIAPESLLGNILIGEFGLLTMTVIYLFGLLLPLIIGFYLALSLMEDSGYLPRLATLVDRVLMGIGLNGRAVIPMILGFGCVTMATITTRLLGSRRERSLPPSCWASPFPALPSWGSLLPSLHPWGSCISLAISWSSSWFLSSWDRFEPGFAGELHRPAHRFAPLAAAPL
jgi:ferrous iron transport protein B